MRYRERPMCRKVIHRLIDSGISLEEIAREKYRYSDGLVKQARKMLYEASRGALS